MSKRSILALLGVIAVGAVAVVLVTRDDSGNSGAASEAKPLDSPFGESVQVGEGATADSNVAIDPRSGRVYVSWATPAEGVPEKGPFATEPHDVWVSASDDGGRTFSEPVQANSRRGEVINVGYNNPPKLVVTGSGDLVLAYGSYDTTKYPGDEDGRFQTYVARSGDGGKSWSRGRPLVDEDGPHSELYYALTARGNTVHAAFLDYGIRASGAPTALRLATSKDGGRTFAPGVIGELRTCQCCDNGLAMDSRGRLFVSYRNEAKQGERNTVRDSAVIYSDDQGKQWSDGVPMGRDNWVFNGCPESGPDVFVDGRDRVHGVFYTGKEGRSGIYYVRSRDRGERFSPPIGVFTGEFVPPATTSVVADAAGDAWLAWDDARTKERQVWLAKVTAGNELQRLERPLGPGRTPALAAHDDRVVMVWATEDGVRVVSAGGARS